MPERDLRRAVIRSTACSPSRAKRMSTRPDRRFHPAPGLALASLLFPALGFAHTGSDHLLGMEAGFSHPFTGLDHLLAMLAVGLWAGQLGADARWKVPAGFVGLMAVGGALTLSGIAVPAIEPGILGSLLVLGIALAASVRVSPWLGAAGVGLFALFHGGAHGLEMPQASHPAAYAVGFLIATILLHLAGLGISRFCRDRAFALVPRFAGIAIATAGVLLTVG